MQHRPLSQGEESRIRGGALANVKSTTLAGSLTCCFLALAGNVQAQDAPREHVITMANMSYGRMPSNVKAGDTIVWVNRDTVPHTATARNKSFDVRVAQGKSARMTAKSAGTIPIYCIFHPAMRGSLKVAAR